MASLHDTAVIKGMSELGKVLEQLPDKMLNKVARVALRESAQVGLSAIQTETPWHTGNLYRHLRIAMRKGTPATQITYIVFVKTGTKRQRSGGSKRVHGPAEPSGQTMPYYWFFIEFGSSHNAANPFMLRGFTKSAENAATRARDIASYQLRYVV